MNNCMCVSAWYLQCVFPDSLKWSTTVILIIDSIAETGLVCTKARCLRSPRHLHPGRLSQDHRLLASYAAGQHRIHHDGRLWLVSSVGPVGSLWWWRACHWYISSCCFRLMICFCRLFFFTVWTDEMCSRVDLGSWITCVHQLKLRSHSSIQHWTQFWISSLLESRRV